MDIGQAWLNVEQHIKAVAESAVARVEQDLPVVAKFLGDAANNPVLGALARAEHLNALPEALTLAANFIDGLEATLVAKAAQPPAAEPAPDAPIA